MSPSSKEESTYRDVNTIARELETRLDGGIHKLFRNLAYGCNRAVERGRNASSK